MDSQSEKSCWDQKPFWCQPWSIIMFGILVLIFSWKLFNSIFITSFLGLAVMVWWVVFLVLAPKAYKVITEQK